jgi:hypothetical protein
LKRLKERKKKWRERGVDWIECGMEGKEELASCSNSCFHQSCSQEPYFLFTHLKKARAYCSHQIRISDTLMLGAFPYKASVIKTEARP